MKSRYASGQVADWLILASGLAAFAMASPIQGLAFAIAALAFSTRFLDTAENRGRIAWGSWAIRLGVGIAFAAFLRMQWAGSLLAFHGAPLAFLLTSSALVAALPARLGFGRPAIAMLAAFGARFARMAVEGADAPTPWFDLGYAAAFACALELARSQQARSRQDPMIHEFALALAIAGFASFRMDSWGFAVALAAAAFVGFAARNHALSRPPPTGERSSNRARAPLAAVAFLGFAAAALLYALLLKTPFWADYGHHLRGPFADLAWDAREVSDAADLDNAAIEAFVERTPDPDWLAQRGEQAKQLASDAIERSRDLAENARETLRSEPREQPEAEQRPPIDAREPRADRFEEYREDRAPLGDRPAPHREPTASPAAIERSRQASGAVARDSDTQGPPRPEARASAYESRISPRSAVAQPIPRVPETGAQGAISSKANAEADGPARLSNQIDLESEASDFAAIPRQELLVATLTLEGGGPRPSRLYLRNDVLDTPSGSGFASSRSADDFRILELEPREGRAVAPEAFQAAAGSSTRALLEIQPQLSETLPLPASFHAIAVGGARALAYHSGDRVIVTPPTRDTLAIRLEGARFEAEPLARNGGAVDYRARYLALPLSDDDRAYLDATATRIAGKRPSTRRFAQRVARHLAERHPYGFGIDIPDGAGHPVVRWLGSRSPGICSHYASAFALLARAKGIPARVATGFATEEFDAEEMRFSARLSDAHAWVEYLDESNRWIRFDPTPAFTDAAERLNASEDLLETMSEALESLPAPALPISAIEAIAQVAPAETAASAAGSEAKLEGEPISRPEDRDAAPELPPTAIASESDSEPSAERALEMDLPDARESEPPAAAAGPAPTRDALEPEPSAPRIPVDARGSGIFSPLALAIALLAVALAAAVVITRSRASRPERADPNGEPPDAAKARRKAGKLLVRAESLLRERRLPEDEGRELREALVSQRYGKLAAREVVAELERALQQLSISERV